MQFSICYMFYVFCQVFAGICSWKNFLINLCRIPPGSPVFWAFPNRFNWNLPANIRLGEDVLKTSSRCLQDVFSVTFLCLQRRLEDVLKTSWRHNCKTSSKRLEVFLEDVLRTKSVTLKTSSRRLENVLENNKCLPG